MGLMSEPQSSGTGPTGEDFVAESEPTVDPEVAAVAEFATPVAEEVPSWRVRHRTTFRLVIGIIVVWLVVMAVVILFKHL
jgi:hypothetical protein